MAIEATIKIGDEETRVRASALLPRFYRATFGRDMIADMNKLQRSLKKSGEEFDLSETDSTIMEDLLYAMVKNADPSVPPIDEWLDGFDDVLSVYQAVPAALELWMQSSKTTSVPRKK